MNSGYAEVDYLEREDHEPQYNKASTTNIYTDDLERTPPVSGRAKDR